MPNVPGPMTSFAAPPAGSADLAHPAAGSVRAPGRSGERFDLVVVGGGIQGLMIALEAARRGLRPVLLERDRLGAGTTRSWFRIVHGGLRYLQHLDLWRLRVSMAERRFFLGNFPDLVEPMPFLMPLHGGGARHPAALRLAFGVEALMTADRNRGVAAGQRIGRGQVLSPDETAALFPGVDRAGLRGGALWQDGLVRDDGRLIEEIARWARAAGAILHEGLAAEGLLVEDGRAAGVAATACEGGGRTVFRAPTVVNAAGPWSDELASRFDPRAPRLFERVTAFNLLLDRPAPAGVGLALAASTGAAIFLYPLAGMTFAGTWYCPSRVDPAGAAPGEEDIEAFLRAIGEAAPELRARREDVVGVFAGVQPRAPSGALQPARRDVIHDHGAAGGPAGLLSVAGVKLTTARFLAETVLRRAALRAGTPLPPVDALAARPSPE